MTARRVILIGLAVLAVLIILLVLGLAEWPGGPEGGARPVEPMGSTGPAERH